MNRKRLRLWNVGAGSDSGRRRSGVERREPEDRNGDRSAHSGNRHRRTRKRAELRGRKTSINKAGVEDPRPEPRRRELRNRTELERPWRICSPPKAEFQYFYTGEETSVSSLFLSRLFASQIPQLTGVRAGLACWSGLGRDGFVGGGHAGEQGIAIQAISWWQSGYSEFMDLIILKLLNQTRRPEQAPCCSPAWPPPTGMVAQKAGESGSPL